MSSDSQEQATKDCSMHWALLSTTESVSGGTKSQGRPFAAGRASSSTRGEAGCLATESVSSGVQDGWGGFSGNYQDGVSRVQEANADSDLAMWEEDSTEEKWYLPVGCTGRRPNTGAMTAVPPALGLKLHNSFSPLMSLTPP